MPATPTTDPRTKPQTVGVLLRAFGAVCRNTPYFRGKWLIVGRVFRRWATRREVADDATLPGGIKLRCNLHDEVGFTIWCSGIHYERKATMYLQSVLKPGMVVCDIGANIGYYSLVAAPIVGPGGRVYAFEPMPPQFSVLRANLQRNGFSWAEAHQLALSDHAGSAILSLDDPNNTGSATLHPVSKGVHTEAVRCERLDDFFRSAPPPRLDLIKIDVEGAEIHVLEGAEETLRRYAPIVLVEVVDSNQQAAGFSMQQLFAWLQDRGYRPHEIGARGLHPMKQPKEATLAAFLPATER